MVSLNHPELRQFTVFQEIFHKNTKTICLHCFSQYQKYLCRLFSLRIYFKRERCCSFHYLSWTDTINTQFSPINICSAVLCTMNLFVTWIKYLFSFFTTTVLYIKMFAPDGLFISMSMVSICHNISQL